MIRQFKRFDSAANDWDSIRFGIFLRFDLGDEIPQPNHCWLLLLSPFQCLVVLPVELTGLTGSGKLL